MKTFSFFLVIGFSVMNLLQAHMSNSHESPNSMSTHMHADSNSGYKEIQTEALARLIHSGNPSLVIIDARTAEYDNGKRIPGAKIIPVNATYENIKSNLLDQDAVIVVYCTNPQCPASHLLADRLVRMGYKNVWEYPAGIEGWEASGQKVEMGKVDSAALKN